MVERHIVIKRDDKYFIKSGWRCWSKHSDKAAVFSVSPHGVEIANYIAEKIGGKVYIIETTEREYDHERDDL